jgi:glucuronate isomerase
MHFAVGDDFLLDSDLARQLYDQCASLPIVDYHSHLPADRLASDEPFANLTDIWIRHDHYKWRAMRLNGVPERLCSGDGSDREKFDAWAATLPMAMRNPLHHWSALELRELGVTNELTPATAPKIWEHTNTQLGSAAFRPRAILARHKVKVVCTTDDPADDLRHHRTLRQETGLGFRVFPTYRPDAALAIHGPKPFTQWLDRLRKTTDTDIGDLDSLLAALEKRHDAFHELGCRLSDHGLDHCYPADATDADAARVFGALRRGKAVTPADMELWRAYLMRAFAAWDREKGWVMMLHLGALRNNNTRMHRRAGLDSGCDSIGDFPQARRLNAFLDSLDVQDRLPKTILFNSNPRDNLLFATIAGNFFEDGVVGKVQHGPAWWFLDTAQGIADQFDALSRVGLARHFVGMVTDSRSFMSFSRHEYFRRILASMVARDVAAGIIPDDSARLQEFMRAVTYENARTWFAWERGTC